MNCRLCEKRRARRFCPAVGGDICAVCCGTEREQTIHCPLDCEHLLEARRREKPRIPDEAELPNADIEVTEEFTRRHAALITVVGGMLREAARQVRGAVDQDLRDALASLVKTYRTLQSGLIYESLPDNPLAAAIHQLTQQQIASLRRQEAQQRGMTTIRDVDILGALVFLQRYEYGVNNGRRLGRAFVSFLEEIGYRGGSGAAIEQPPPSIVPP